MNVYYVDASAWVKLYLTEPGSNEVSSLFNELSREQLASTGLGYVEVASTLARQQTARKLNTHAATIESRLEGFNRNLNHIGVDRSSR